MNDYEDTKLRVRYAETDQMGVVYYANYFVYFEVGRAEFVRNRGFSYNDMEKDAGSYLIVAESHCRYRRSLRYDMEFIVRTRIKELRKRTVRFSYEIIDPSGGLVFAEGETVHVVTDRHGRPRSFAPEFLRFFESDTSGGR
jgi:acyl-CoA thioester hydrolase